MNVSDKCKAGFRHIFTRCGLIGIIGIALTGCDRAQSINAAPAVEPADPTPVLRMDADHSMLGARGGVMPYVPQAGDAIVLDPADVRLSDPDRLGRVPTTVQLLYGKSSYEADWPNDGSPVRLDRSTLRVINGERFESFSPGQHAYVAVGIDLAHPSNPAPDSGKSDSGKPVAGKLEHTFKPFWVGSVFFAKTGDVPTTMPQADIR
jgi:hypothetical protein